MSKSDSLRYGPPGENAVHLCVDMQRMFAEATAWKMPWLERVLPNIVAITSAHAKRTVFTRFIPAREPGQGVGMWRHPWRLDLDWRWHQTALRLGCMMSINPDAHSTREIDLTHWGVEMARKGGVPKERVLNCLNKEEFAEYLANRRDQRRGRRLTPGRRIPRARTVRAKAKKASLAVRKKRSVAS